MSVEKLSELSRLLNDIAKMSNLILVKYIPLLSNIDSLYDDVLEDVRDHTKFNRVTDEDIAKTLQDILLSTTDDAKTYKKEIGPFCQCLLQGKEIDVSSQQYQKLCNIWFGDEYGVDGIDALRMLHSELSDSLSNTEPEHFSSRVMKKLSL